MTRAGSVTRLAIAALGCAAGLALALAVDSDGSKPPATGAKPVPAAKSAPNKPGNPLPHPDPGLLAIHGHGKAEVLESPVPETAEPEGVILVSAHTSGWLTPCGCPGSQAGGVGRRAGYAQQLREKFPGLPIHYYDLGGFTAPGGEVQRALNEAVVGSYNRLGYEGTNVAFEDLATIEGETEIEGHLKVPRFSANVVYQDTGRLAFPPYRIVEIPSRRAGGQAKPVRVGILGLMDERRNLFAFGPDGRSLVCIKMSEALERSLPELRAKTDLVVLFAETRIEVFYALLKRFKPDLIIAGTGGDFITEPLMIEDVPVLAIGNQGKYLAELRVTRGEDGKPAIAPIVHWLDERYREEPALAKFAEQTLDRINELSRADVAKDTSPPRSISPYVGGETCAPCHEHAMEVWKTTKHAHALDTLKGLKRDYSVSCVTCHVTGLGPDVGGFANPLATPQLTHVQCEACHGPGNLHLADPTAAYGQVKKELCNNCHSRATDPTFDYETRWSRIAH